MSEPLWTPEAIAGAVGGGPSQPVTRAINGVSIDSRTVEPGDLFVAIKGDTNDGHDFVDKAFAMGAAAAIVHSGFESAAGPLFYVADPLAAMSALGVAARARSKSRIIAITGSVGKTGTKEALKACLTPSGKTHASEKSYNNHWGVPLTLARMPSDAKFGVFEIGMNHPGEITPLTRMVRPDIAIITTVAPVHIGFFGSEEAIADAKAEIFTGLEPGGVAILNRDNRHFDRLAAVAKKFRIVSFGTGQDCDCRVIMTVGSDRGSKVEASILGERLSYRIGAPGAHYVMNSLAVLGAVKLAGGDLEQAVQAFADIKAPVGRGERTRFAVAGGEIVLIDESYNANPASVRAALSAMAATPRQSSPRRIVVLGDMRELGEQSSRLHRELLQPVIDSGADRVHTVGPYMAELFQMLPKSSQGACVDQALDLNPVLAESLKAGDIVMVKGSLGTKMGPIVDHLKTELARRGDGYAAKKG